MFEAHIYSPEPLQPSAEHGLQPCEPVLCWHPAHNCNLAVWFTPGKRHGQQISFIYFEYRRADNSHGSVQTEISDTPDFRRLQLLTADQTIGDLDSALTEEWHRQREL